MTELRRGDIALVAGGVYASKPRPTVILQDDLFTGIDSVTVCPFTTTEVDAPLLRMALPADDATGIDSESFVMIDKVTTVRRSNVSEPIGGLVSAGRHSSGVSTMALELPLPEGRDGKPPQPLSMLMARLTRAQDDPTREAGPQTLREGAQPREVLAPE